MSLPPRNDNQRPFLLLAAFSRALGHQLRTPLSVISNDLAYFETLLPDGECQRSIRKCREIQAIISSATVQHPSEGFIEAFSVARAVNAACEKAGISLDQVNAGDLSLKGALSLFTAALDYTVQALLKHAGVSKHEIRVRMAQFEHRDALEILVQTGQPNQTLRCCSGAAALSEMFLERLGVDDLGASLADAYFWAHGCDLHFCFEDTLGKLIIAFPD